MAKSSTLIETSTSARSLSTVQHYTYQHMYNPTQMLRVSVVRRLLSFSKCAIASKNHGTVIVTIYENMIQWHIRLQTI